VLLFSRDRVQSSTDNVEVVFDRADCQSLVERRDRRRSMVECRVEDDGVGKAQACVGSQRSPSLGRIAVDINHLKRCTKRRSRLVKHAQLYRCDKTLGKRHRVEQGAFVAHQLIDCYGRCMMRIVRVAERNDPTRVGDDHSGQSSLRSYIAAEPGREPTSARRAASRADGDRPPAAQSAITHWMSLDLGTSGHSRAASSRISAISSVSVTG
jgi:hypothetical protein